MFLPKVKAIMALFVVAALCSAGGLVCRTQAGEQPKAEKELKALEGKWKKVKFLHFDFESILEPGDDDVIVEFKGKTIDFDKMATGEVVEVDPATDPKCLDFKMLKGSSIFKNNSTYESIYKLDGDTLTMAVYWGRGKKRPTTLNKPTEARVIVMVLKRVKE
jgi:uncharacterized protein (TIGR03067 family)